MEDSRSKMEYYSSHISKLIEQLSRLPGIGAKSAQRLAFHIINMPKDQVEQLAGAMTSARSNVRYCKECFTLTDQELCPICANPKRNHKQIMVVENTRDLAAYEKTGKYEGVYHVLHGAISPMLGIGPGDIRLKELMLRLQKDVDEVIIATNSSLEGETTAMYISKLIKPTGIKVRGGRKAGLSPAKTADPPVGKEQKTSGCVLPDTDKPLLCHAAARHRSHGKRIRVRRVCLQHPEGSEDRGKLSADDAGSAAAGNHLCL